MFQKKIHQSLRTLGRKAVCKQSWHENCERSSEHATADFRRDRVQAARVKENHHLRSAFANGELDIYEPLYVAQRDADWFYF